MSDANSQAGSSAAAATQQQPRVVAQNSGMAQYASGGSVAPTGSQYGSVPSGIYSQQITVPNGTGSGWEQVHHHVSEFGNQMADMSQYDPQKYYTGESAISALYGGVKPPVGFFDQMQYLPMNANFYIPPGSGLPYMDPYGRRERL